MPRIVTLPGDGIGPEVLAPAVRILTQLVPGVEVDEHVFGGHSIDVHGTALTDDTLAACREADAVLLAAVGGPKWDTTTRRSRVPSRACSACARSSACSRTCAPSARCRRSTTPRRCGASASRAPTCSWSAS
jgi:hypothetical protein